VIPKTPQRKNTLWDIKIEITKDGLAPIAFPEKMAAFDQHKKVLLANLRKVNSRKPEPLDADKSWRDLTHLARLYFSWRKSEQGAMPGAERRERLHQLASALRLARGLTDRAIKDDVGIYLYKSWCAKSGIQPNLEVPVGKDGSSILTRKADEIKQMAAALATLQTIAQTALANDKPDKAGRSALLPRDCIQGLARVYRNSTGTKPGRGAGPFADFASEFMVAIGQTGFSHTSLIDAIQDAHRRFKPSWFDGKPPPS
jgi:hypothetical protein